MPSASDAATLEEVTDYTTANVTGVVKAPDGGIAIKAEEKGFDGGILTVIMGFDANGAETGICGRFYPDQGHRLQCVPPMTPTHSSTAWTGTKNIG